MKVTIDKHLLDDSYKGTIELEAAVFAFEEKVPGSDDEYQLYGDEYKECPEYIECGKPAYLLFVDTTEYDKLWKETIKRMRPGNFRKKLQRKYRANPGLEQKLSMKSKYNVPAELLDIPHMTGGGHGDLRLRYKDSTVLFIPLSDFGYFANGFSEGWDILMKTNPELLKKYNISII